MRQYRLQKAFERLYEEQLILFDGWLNYWYGGFSVAGFRDTVDLEIGKRAFNYAAWEF